MILPYMDTAPAEKKKPGRPRKKDTAVSLPIHGICDAPSEEGIICEFASGTIEVMKKTLALQKSYSVNEVEIRFDATSICFKSIDNSQKARLATQFDCHNTHRYFCGATGKIVSVVRSHLDKLIDNLNKEHDMVRFVLFASDCKLHLYCFLHNTVRKSVKDYTIPVVSCEDIPEALPEAVPVPYPLSFCLPSKELKTKMASLKQLSPLMAIQKIGQGPMQFVCESNKDVDCKETFHEGSSIGMLCTLETDEILRVTVFTDLIKSFAHHVVGASCLLKVDHKRDLVVTSSVSCHTGPICTMTVHVLLNTNNIDE